MIKITSKTNCCGCGACSQICQFDAIKMQEDEEGFLYPTVDKNKCTECELCLKICPINNNNPKNFISKCYAAINKDNETVRLSTSAGMFSIFAEHILKLKGVVFGAVFDEYFNVKHSYAENTDDLDKIRRSKYVQSDIGGSYRQVKTFLDNGRYVLFTGTPCQIAGLKNYLQKGYENLYVLDIICHSVPSPRVWKMFLEQNFEISTIDKINFRDKSFGWDKSYLKFYFSDGTVCPLHKKSGKIDNLSYYKGFFAMLYSRPSCHDCKFRGAKKYSDMTMADFWGIKNVMPEMYDTKGVSALTLNSEKGYEIFKEIKNNAIYKETNIKYLELYNPCLVKSLSPNPKRQEFFRNYQIEPLNHLINRLLYKSFFKKCIIYLKMKYKILTNNIP